MLSATSCYTTRAFLFRSITYYSTIFKLCKDKKFIFVPYITFECKPLWDSSEIFLEKQIVTEMFIAQAQRISHSTISYSLISLRVI